MDSAPLEAETPANHGDFPRARRRLRPRHGRTHWTRAVPHEWIPRSGLGAPHLGQTRSPAPTAPMAATSAVAAEPPGRSRRSEVRGDNLRLGNHSGAGAGSTVQCTTSLMVTAVTTTREACWHGVSTADGGRPLCATYVTARGCPMDGPVRLLPLLPCIPTLPASAGSTSRCRPEPQEHMADAGVGFNVGSHCGGGGGSVPPPPGDLGRWPCSAGPLSLL